jgi:hypothetical protein
VEAGVLYASGMIAGEGLVGILLAVFAVLGLNINMSGIYGDQFEAVGNWVGLVAFAVLLATLFFVCRKKKTIN